MATKSEGAASPSRAALGVVGLAALVATFAALDGSSMRAWVVSFIVAVPVMGLAMVSILASDRSGRRSLLVFGAALALACTIIVPLGIGRRYPRRGGGGPSPSCANSAAITGGVLSSAALLILVAVAVHRKRHRSNG